MSPYLFSLSNTGLRVIQKVRGDLVRKYIGTFEDPNSVVAEYIYHCNVQKPT